MDVFYHCRYCGTQVGCITRRAFDVAQLGFNILNNQERSEFIKYNDNGCINVYTICEDCQEALELNPELHQFDLFIQ